MTRVEIGPQHIKITGHAGFANVGDDIVCAAVSALGQALKHIDELHREYEQNDTVGMLRVDIHDSKSLIQAYAIDRHEYLNKQLQGEITMDERQEIEEELGDWDNRCRQFAQMAQAKGLIIKNQVALIVKGLEEIAKDYPDNVEVVYVD